MDFNFKLLPIDLFSLTDNDLLMSTLKKAEQIDGLILRVYNPTDQVIPLSFESRLPNHFFEVDLKEEKSKDVRSAIQQKIYFVKTNQLKTILMK